ncbi:MAG: ABC transporter substrate-binding protein [Anaerolineaceae bacterium]|nr:ABC transporter substrate-binding protein [Anaerolineaceae bacterium]
MKHKLFRFLILVLVSTIVLSACAPAATAPTQASTAPAGAQAPAQGGSLVIGLATEPVSLDPAAGLYIAEQFLLMNIYDPLIWVDPDLNLKPGLATAWESNDEGTQFTLKLRQDVKFHDGTPFNAVAVKQSFDRDAVAQNPAAVAPTLLTDYVGTTVVDDYTVTVEFSAPKATFFEDLSRIWMVVPSPAAVEEYGADFGQHPVGTGPFVFSEWAPQDHITLKRNPDYNWGPEFASHQGPALLDEVTFRFLPEAVTRLNAYQSGEAQVVEEPAYQEAATLAEDPANTILRFTAPGMPSHMMINTGNAPTDDIQVRQALIYAVNQEELVQTAFFGMQTPVHSVISPTTWGYDEQAASLYRFDLDKANQLLEEAGWVDSDGDGIREKDGQKLHIEYPALPAYEEAYMELLAAYLTKAGFEVNITRLDDAGVTEFGLANKHNILNMGWISRDPSVLNITYNSANIEQGASYTRFKNDELDQALNDAPQTLDPEARKQLYVTAQRIIMDNALVIPLYAYDRVFLMQAGVQGWQFDPEGFPYLYEVSLQG